MRTIIAILLSLLLMPAALAQDSTAHGRSRPNLTILMDEGLILPSAMLARLYAKSYRTPLTMAVRNPDTENQIGQGLDAHIMLSADEALIERLAAQGLTDVSTIRSFTETPLVLVTTKNSSAHELITKHISFAAMVYGTPKLDIYTEPSITEAGSRSAALMHGYEFSESLSSRIRIKSSREEILALLREKDGLALMLESDVASEPDIAILSVLPATLSKPVRYKVAVLASESMDDARNFANFLESKQAQDALKKAGFEQPGKD